MSSRGDNVKLKKLRLFENWYHIYEREEQSFSEKLGQEFSPVTNKFKVSF